MARPTKLTPQSHKAIVDALALGATRKDAAGAAGVDYVTLLDWLKKGEAAKSGAFSEFSNEVHKTEADVRLKFTMTFAKAAQSGDWRAAAAYLKMRDPENWVERQEVTGAGGSDIIIKVTVANGD